MGRQQLAAAPVEGCREVLEKAEAKTDALAFCIDPAGSLLVGGGPSGFLDVLANQSLAGVGHF